MSLQTRLPDCQTQDCLKHRLHNRYILPKSYQHQVYEYYYCVEEIACVDDVTPFHPTGPLAKTGGLREAQADRVHQSRRDLQMQKIEGTVCAEMHCHHYYTTSL